MARPSPSRPAVPDSDCSLSDCGGNAGRSAWGTVTQRRFAAKLPVVARLAMGLVLSASFASASLDQPVLAAGPEKTNPGKQQDDQDTREALTDHDIRQAISSDLEDTERLVDDRIEVSVRDGLVTLSGRVVSLMDKRRAADVAKRTRDVRGVLNRIVVRPPERSDKAIRKDVEMRLRTNDSLERREIVVDVAQGEVSLTGPVNSLAEKRLAETAAAGVRGVTDIENQITVEYLESRPDEELREEIKGLIVNSVYFDDVQIDVRVAEGVVSLSGVVGSAAQRDRLKQRAEILGVSEVNLEGVSIDPSLLDGTRRKQKLAEVSDEQINQAISRVFVNDPIVFIAANAIDVSVDSGVVTLTGDVTRLRAKRKAERLAMDVVGVQRVNNNLNVEFDGETPPDATIIPLVQEAMKRSPYLNRNEIRVHCDRAHVSLYGIVDSHLEKDVAGWIASGVPGVVHVNNALAIEGPTSDKSDQEIQQDLERKLRTALFSSSQDIEVEVRDGVALLTGTVDTWRQWQAALNLALEAGSEHPHNLLRVRYHPPHGASDVYVPR